MRKALYPTLLTCLLLIYIIVACEPSSTQTSRPETETPVPTAGLAETATLVVIPTASPTETATTPEFTPTASLVPVTPTSPFAPFCEPDVASTLTAPLCQHPVAEQSSAFCLSKKPYNLILIDAGGTYELLSEGFECSDAGMKDGKQMLLCNGPMGTSFEIKACGQACVLPTLPAGISPCPQGAVYNEPLGCCAYVSQPAEPSCVLLTLETKRCVTNCAEYTEDGCNHHYHACLWDDEDKVCKVRR